MSTKQSKKPSPVVVVELSQDMIFSGILACAISASDEAKSRDARIASWGEWIPKLHSAKVTIGRRNGKGACPYAKAFHDEQVAQGLTSKTASNYLTLFKACVESGELPTDSNMHRKPKAKPKIQNRLVRFSLKGLISTKAKPSKIFAMKLNQHSKMQSLIQFMKPSLIFLYVKASKSKINHTV